MVRSNCYRQLAFSLFVVAISVSLSCVTDYPDQKNFPNYSGSLLIVSHSDLMSYTLRNGLVTNLTGSRSLCSLPPLASVPDDSSVVFSTCGQVLMEELPASLIKFSPLTRRADPIRTMANLRSSFYSIDYDPHSKRFLSCEWNGASGEVFLLDSNFQVISNLTALFESRRSAIPKPLRFEPLTPVIRACFLNPPLVTISDRLPLTLVYNLETMEYSVLEDSGHLLEVSHDKKSILIGSEDGDKLIMIDLVTKKRRQINVDSTPWEVAFSPDDVVIAFSHATDTFGGEGVALWDLANDRITDISFEPGSNSGKGLLWLDYEIPQ